MHVHVQVWCVSKQQACAGKHSQASVQGEVSKRDQASKAERSHGGNANAAGAQAAAGWHAYVHVQVGSVCKQQVSASKGHQASVHVHGQLQVRTRTCMCKLLGCASKRPKRKQASKAEASKQRGQSRRCPCTGGCSMARACACASECVCKQQTCASKHSQASIHGEVGKRVQASKAEGSKGEGGCKGPVKQHAVIGAAARRIRGRCTCGPEVACHGCTCGMKLSKQSKQASNETWKLYVSAWPRMEPRRYREMHWFCNGFRRKRT